MNNHSLTNQGQQLRLPKEFNGPYLLNLLEEIVESGNPRIVDVDSICINLTKNWKLLLNFNYKINQNTNINTTTNNNGRNRIDKDYLNKAS